MNQVFVESLPPAGQAALIAGDEHHYLTRAVRARLGDPVRLADGRGGAAEAKLEAIDASAASAVVGAVLAPEPAEGFELLLCPPKGDALELALDQAAQLGLASVSLVRSSRTLANFEGSGLRPERLQRVLREACRQCRRSRVPALAGTLDWQGALALGPGWLASERGGFSLGEAAAKGPLPRRLLVGPEGGFSAAELDAAAAAGWTAVSLGAHPLRTPTAVAALLAGLKALDPRPN